MRKIKTIKKILNLKENRKREVEIEVRKAAERLDEERAKLISLEKDYHETLRVFSEKSENGMLTVKNITSYYEFLSSISGRINEQKDVHAQRKNELDVLKSALVHAHKDKKVFELLKDKSIKRDIRDKAVSDQKGGGLYDHCEENEMIKYAMITVGVILLAVNAFAEVDIISRVEQQSKVLSQKEEQITRETERLTKLKKDVEADIEKYTNILKEIEKVLKEAEEKADKRLKHVAKAYEAMAPEDAAPRISGLDNPTAVQILLKMDSKKAGLVMGMMDRDKATVLTKDLARLKK